MNNQDWNWIDELLQSLRIVQSGPASADFEALTHARMSDAVQDQSVPER